MDERKGQDMEYGVGSIIRYQTWDGSIREVRVTTRESDIKNGEPGFSGDMAQADSTGSRGVWGYDEQIVEVVR